MTLKTGLGVRRSIDHIRLSGPHLYHVPFLSYLTLNNIVTWVRGHSVSFKLVPFESLNAVSYSPSIVTGALKMTDMKLQDMKMADQIARHENARREIDGPSSRA